MAKDIGPKKDKYTSLLAAHLFQSSESGYEIQRTNNFEIQITGLDTIVRAGYSADDQYHGYSQKIWEKLTDPDTVQELIMSTKAGFSPKENVSTIEIQYGNSKLKYAGIPSYDDGSITFNDFYNKDTELLLKAWQAAAYDASTGAVGDGEDYKRTAYLTMFSPGGRRARRWKLIGCWVSTVNGDDFSNDGNSPRALSATFVYDSAIRLEDWSTESVTVGAPMRSDLTSDEEGV